MKELKSIIKKDFFRGSDLDISKSGKYMVRSTNSKIWLTDFNTKEVIKTIKANCFIINDISDDDKFCVFTFKGERGIKVLSLPDLEEVAQIDTNDEYIKALIFFSNHEIAYFTTKLGGSEYSLKIWNFLTGEIKVVYSDPGDGYVAYKAFFDKGLLYLPLQDGSYKYGKYSVLHGESCLEHEIKGSFYYESCSQILNNTILIEKRLDLMSDYLLGTYDLITKNFSPIVKRKKPDNLFWLSQHLFWASDLEQTSIMNLNGDMLMSFDQSSRVSHCSNEKYFVCSNAFGSYLFEKVFA